MDYKKTNRGFTYGDFTDAYGKECSLQESSLAAEEGHVWFGCDEIELKRFEPGKGWTDVDLRMDGPNGVNHSANTRMHLSQSMVRELLPALQYFAETGRLPG